jgi:hypothetical protein
MVDVEEKDDKRIFLMVAGLGFLGLMLASAVAGDDFAKSRCVLYCNDQGYDRNGNESPDWYSCFEKCMNKEGIKSEKQPELGINPVLCPI